MNLVVVGFGCVGSAAVRALREDGLAVVLKREAEIRRLVLGAS
jgi:prephenate dehydrogenase